MYNLREPQTITYDKIRNSAKEKKRKILVMAATGFGKTILSYEIIKNAIAKNNSVLFTCHRITLAEQSFKKFKSFNPDYLQGNSATFENESNLLVATIQTLLNTEIKQPKIVIIDEVHYGFKSDMIQSLFKKFPDALFIGLSATPVDDNNYLLDGFDTIIDDYQIPDLIDLKWLVPFKIYAPIKVELPEIKITAGDYNNKELSDAVNKIDINKSIVQKYIELGENKKFILFGVNKQHCKDFKLLFDSENIPTEIIDANTSESKRIKILNDYHTGKIKGMLSIEILTTGFDEPTVECIIFACPTKSWKKYIQCCGRGIRLNGLDWDESESNGKTYCILLDCAGSIEEHGMPDERKVFKFGKKISRVIDKEMNLDQSNDNRISVSEGITEERQIYLKKIGRLLDLYEDKVYSKESELQEDVNKYLEKTNYFWWRQNSGKAFIKDRWVHFASKNGLPDNTVFFEMTSFYFALELKLKTGSLTTYQKETLPEMTHNKVLFFICQSVYDVYKAIEHVESNIIIETDGIKILNSIYELPTKQIEYRTKLKIPTYG